MASAFADKRILVAEDDALVAMMIVETLHDLGFVSVDVAPSLGAALSLVRDSIPDIALLDIQLTDGISLRVAEVLAASSIPCVFMSGNLEAEADTGLSPGSVLLKPFSPAELQERLQAAFELPLGEPPPTSFSHNDYLAAYNQGGAEALNALLRKRYPIDEVRLSELNRMEKSGFWQVAWDLEGGDAVILGPVPT